MVEQTTNQTTTATTPEQTTAVLTTGRRKTASARVWLRPEGTGKILVNGRPIENYFPRLTDQMLAKQAIKVVKITNRYDIVAKVSGGGLTGQAGAIRLGIARALLTVDANLKSSLRQMKLLTRDPRAKERKKYGRRGARRSGQYSKR